ncbi:hypothetical protein THOG05_10028 [Vibrio rotiferianus]|nr:hypothetical protein THOG05_10028 [Vibrio rotiferianus]
MYYVYQRQIAISLDKGIFERRSVISVITTRYFGLVKPARVHASCLRISV